MHKHKCKINTKFSSFQSVFVPFCHSSIQSVAANTVIIFDILNVKQA